jgi:hypothetical protein
MIQLVKGHHQLVYLELMLLHGPQKQAVVSERQIKCKVLEFHNHNELEVIKPIQRLQVVPKPSYHIKLSVHKQTKMTNTSMQTHLQSMLKTKMIITVMGMTMTTTINLFLMKVQPMMTTMIARFNRCMMAVAVMGLDQCILLCDGCLFHIEI